LKKRYEKLMRRCLALAEKGSGRVSPNPLTGAVIFDDDFNIISEGYHAECGKNHAERSAILNTQADLKGKSIIVNLEPCSHWGKTPPCADLIIEKGIKRAVFGMIDPNPIVSGKGAAKLKDAGIEVIEGVLEDECRRFNEIFVKNQTKNLPFIMIKTACTLDGKTASRTGSSKWITDDYSRSIVHKLRNRYDAVLTGSGTVIKDNPLMTCRIKGGRNPARIVLDTNLKTNPESSIYNNDGAKVIIIAGENTADKRIKQYGRNVKIIKCPLNNEHIDLNRAVELIYKEGISSIMVEAGAAVNNSFIQEGLADKLIQFTAPKILSDKEGKGFSEGCIRENISECNNLKIDAVKKLKNDIIIIGYFL